MLELSDIGTPGHADIDTLMTTTGLEMDCPSTSQLPSPGHQGGTKTGDINPGLRVLQCTNLSTTVDYEDVYLLMKKFGEVNRIRLILATDKLTFDCYVVFKCNESASQASKHFCGHLVNDSVVRTRLFHIDNFKDQPYDYFPVETKVVQVNREAPLPVWFVATYKEGAENMIKATEILERKVGTIPKGNLKRYGKSLLIKAGNPTQTQLLINFKTPQSGNLERVTPHKSFWDADGCCLVLINYLYKINVKLRIAGGI